MKTYKSIKTVHAEPMDRLVAEAKGLVRDKKNELEDGYIVLYEDNYTSWSPKDVFEAGYIELEKTKADIGCSEQSLSKEETVFMQKRESIINLIDECKENLEKMEEDENYATGFLINLGKKAESGDIDAAIKVGIIAKLMEDE